MFFYKKKIGAPNHIIFAISFLLSFFAYMTNSNANTLDLPKASELNGEIEYNHPYIIKKRDTLWDIANYFFKNPSKWVSIWEKNNYIENPNLIYPGNKIWITKHGISFKKPLRSETITLKPLVKEIPSDLNEKGVEINAERKVDFISNQLIDDGTYVLAGTDGRMFFAKGDIVYIKSSKTIENEVSLSVIRKNKEVNSLKNKNKKLGVVVTKFGTIKIISNIKGEPLNHIYKGVIVKASEEISAGDILVPLTLNENKIKVNNDNVKVKGKVVYIGSGGTIASETQLVIVELDNKAIVNKGQVLFVYNKDKIIQDPLSESKVHLNGEKIGKLIVLKSNGESLTCIVLRSSESVLVQYLVKSIK